MSFIDRRKNKRIADALAIRIETGSPASFDKSSSTIRVVKLSTSGMRFSYASKLPEDEPLKVSMTLGPNRKEVNIEAEVANCTESTGAAMDSRYSTRLVFKNVDDQTRNILEQHIDYVFDQTRVLKELPYRKSA